MTIQIGFNSGIKGNVDRWNLPFYAVVCIDQPQPCPVIAIPLDVFAAQNRSYQIRRASALVFGLAVGENLIALGSADNKGIVTAGLDTVVDLDVPIL